MKAWLVIDYEDCVFPVHAETRGKAISTIQAGHPACDPGEFTDFRARRLDRLDNSPFTFENTNDIYTNDEFEYDYADFVNWCCCDVCVIDEAVHTIRVLPTVSSE